MENVSCYWTVIAWSAAGLAFGVVAGMVALIAIAMCLPPKFLQDPDSCFRISATHPVLFWTWTIGKNLAGYVAIVVGCLLAFPGVPGPGLPIVLLGIVMIDIPGKRWLVRKLLSLPGLVRGINAIRARCGLPHLIPQNKP
jgi:hypothetical protein